MSSGNLDEERIKIIKDLVLEEGAIGEPVVFNITVLQSIIEYERSAFDKLDEFQNAVLQDLEKARPFAPRHRSPLNEGFIRFSQRENHLECYYLREMPFRWDYVNIENRSIESLSVKRVDPAYRVRISILFEDRKVTLSFFGGVETLVFRARELVCDAVKSHVYNFTKRDVSFSPNEMRSMLSRFGKYVDLIDIDPRDNERFSKIVEEKVSGKPEVKRVIVYDVFNVRMTGIRITISPEVARLMEEEGIRLTEMRGGLWLEIGIKITTRVKSNGRVEFSIPAKHFGDDEDKVYDAAVGLYSKLLPTGVTGEKGPLERWI